MPEAIPRPPTLRAFLEAGLVPDPDTLRKLVELVLLEIPTAPPGRVEDWAHLYRRDSEALLDGEDIHGWGKSNADKSPEHRLAGARCELWLSELCEDIELRGLLVDIAPEELVTEYVQNADHELRPHPLVVGPVDPSLCWSCGNCGEVHGRDDGSIALSVTDRPGYSDLDAPIRYCLPCVRGALTGVDKG